MYLADGDCNAIVSIDHASSLLVKDEITVGAGCKSFKCKYPSTTCGKLVKAGSPLNKPFAATILPNGNMVVANTGNNTLVELMPSGKVLATKVVDKSKDAGYMGPLRDRYERRQHGHLLHRHEQRRTPRTGAVALKERACHGAS